jgi:aarF domain-containing kinase
MILRPPPPLLLSALRPPCLRHPLLPPPPIKPLLNRQTSSLASRILPPALSFRRSNPQRKVRRTRPLPLSPTKSVYYRRYRRLLYYTIAFLVSGGVTYTALQPDNIVNHVIHGVIRCSRVTWALAHSVYDYRMTMRRKYENEEEGRKAMSECHLRSASRALHVFEKNGGIYVKLGQHLAALSYLIPIVIRLKT